MYTEQHKHHKLTGVDLICSARVNKSCYASGICRFAHVRLNGWYFLFGRSHSGKGTELLYRQLGQINGHHWNEYSMMFNLLVMTSEIFFEGMLWTSQLTWRTFDSIASFWSVILYESKYGRRNEPWNFVSTGR